MGVKVKLPFKNPFSVVIYVRKGLQTWNIFAGLYMYRTVWSWKYSYIMCVERTTCVTFEIGNRKLLLNLRYIHLHSI